MKPLESRITALERARKKPLPEYTLTLADGSEARLDALDAILYAAQAKAGKKGIIPIVSAVCTLGELPTAGTVWAELASNADI